MFNKNFLLLILLLLKTILSLKPTDLCNKEYNFLSYSINLEKLKSYMGRYTFVNDEQVSKNENERKKLKLFYQRIENCPGIIYEWKASDICINGLHCIAQKIVPMRSGI